MVGISPEHDQRAHLIEVAHAELLALNAWPLLAASLAHALDIDQELETESDVQIVSDAYWAGLENTVDLEALIRSIRKAKNPTDWHLEEFVATAVRAYEKIAPKQDLALARARRKQKSAAKAQEIDGQKLFEVQTGLTTLEQHSEVWAYVQVMVASFKGLLPKGVSLDNTETLNQVVEDNADLINAIIELGLTKSQNVQKTVTGLTKKSREQTNLIQEFALKAVKAYQQGLDQDNQAKLHDLYLSFCSTAVWKSLRREIELNAKAELARHRYEFDSNLVVSVIKAELASYDDPYWVAAALKSTASDTADFRQQFCAEATQRLISDTKSRYNQF